MLKFVLLVAIVGTAAAQLARPRSGDYRDIQIVRSAHDNDGLGTYSYSYENSDGSAAAQKGFLNAPVGTAEPAQQVEGFYSYNSPEGTPIRIDYIANELGYQPRGDALPVGPPIPEAILRSLEIIRQSQNGRSGPVVAESRRPAPARAQPSFRGSRF